MTKEKITISYRIKHLFTHRPWLKLIALALAVFAWFYVGVEMSRFN